MGSDRTASELGGILDGARADADAAVRGAHEAVAGLRPLIEEVVRTVTDVDTIKALADTTRLAILRALSRDRVPKSAKELAEDLSEPQTKLYRHLKVLLEAGLIEVAETRVVSGIVETRYRAAQSSVTIDPSDHLDETREAMSRIIGGNLEDYRKRFLRAIAAQEPSADKDAMRRQGMIMNLSVSVPAAVADEFQDRLEALVKEFDEFPRDPDGVRVDGLLSWFRPVDPKRSKNP